MSDEGPSKADISTVFKKLRSAASNKVCFDCGAKNPTWSSVTYGVFICIDCSAIHRGLGVHVSFVRSTQLDTNWTWLQLRAMQVGGNANATQFFRQHSCNSTDAQQKYKSRAAQLYKEKLHQQAVAAMRLHGYKLHIDNYHNDQMSPHSPSEKESDFFEEHTKSSSADMTRNESQTSMSDEAFIISAVQAVKVATEDTNEGPNVEPVICDSEKPTTKSVIGQRSAAGKKTSNIGGKKGLGAQKLNANFSAIEKEAESIERSSSQPTLDDTFAKDAGNEPVGMSARLMVRDSEDKKKEEQLKRSDPKKYEQSERLGMAKGTKSAVQHSVFAEMKPIQQEGEKISGSNFESVLKSSRMANLDDDWEVLNTEPSKSGRDTRKRNDDFFDEYSKPAKDSSTSSWGSSSYDKNRNKVATNLPASSEDAQKKFGNAKAISSDQFFGDQSSDFQSRSTFNRFEGQSAISSSDFFGSDARGGSSGSGKGYNISTPDVAEIKDSVRQGVTKVAGKLSQLSNSVSSYMSNYNN